MPKNIKLTKKREPDKRFLKGAKRSSAQQSVTRTPVNASADQLPPMKPRKVKQPATPRYDPRDMAFNNVIAAAEMEVGRPLLPHEIGRAASWFSDVIDSKP